MRIVVTGCSGFVGSAVLEACNTQKMTGIGVGRSGSVALDITHSSFAELLSSRVRSCDAVVHCAASLSLANDDLSVPLVNCVGVHNVIAAALLMKARVIVFLSSIQVIGRPVSLPIDEDHPVLPETSYHASKLYGEHMLRIASGTSLRTVIMRLTSPIGRGASTDRIFGRYVSCAMKGEQINVFGNGLRKQNYVDVRDVAKAVLQAIPLDVSGVFNVAGQSSITNMDLARLCVETLNSKSPIVHSGYPDPEEGLAWEVSIKKARRELAYCPIHSIGDSIRYFARYP